MLRQDPVLALALAPLILVAGCGAPDPTHSRDAGENDVTPTDARPSGLTVKTEAVAPGYVLYSPLSSGTTYLLDTDGRTVHTWESEYGPQSVYLRPDGTLLRPGRDLDNPTFTAGGSAGVVQLFSWDGDLLWEWKLSDDNRILHHDIEPLPNGNLLAIGWEVKSREEALAAGRRPDLLPEKGLWPDFILEIEPLPPDDARIVWTWHVWDHLIQDHDPDMAGYGAPAEHPRRIDINGGGPQLQIDDQELEMLQALGYVPETEEAEETDETDETSDENDNDDQESELRPDFLHLNAVEWHPELDQIAMTSPERGELWIIARPSSTEEAAGPAGDLLYRWGNPASYGRGAPSDKTLFYPHDVQWIPAGYPGAGHLTVFNNGNGRPEGEWSSLEELVPPLASDGSYRLDAGRAFGPGEPVWSYQASEPERFYASFISGAHRLPNGNSFVTSGPQGRLFEVTRQGEIVWEFWNPYWGDIRKRDGTERSTDTERFGVWRARKIPPDHPGLAGRELRPLDPQPEVQ